MFVVIEDNVARDVQQIRIDGYANQDPEDSLFAISRHRARETVGRSALQERADAIANHGYQLPPLDL